MELSEFFLPETPFGTVLWWAFDTLPCFSHTPPSLEFCGRSRQGISAKAKNKVLKRYEYFDNYFILRLTLFLLVIFFRYEIKILRLIYFYFHFYFLGS